MGDEWRKKDKEWAEDEEEGKTRNPIVDNYISVIQESEPWRPLTAAYVVGVRVPIAANAPESDESSASLPDWPSRFL